MSKKNVQGFYDFIKDNEELNKALTEAAVAGNTVVLAKEKGFEFTQAEHDEFISEITEDLGKLSDDQLEEVAGGGLIPVPQIKVTCTACGWSSGWQSAAKTTAALKFIHMTETKFAHLDFMPDSRWG